MQYFRRGVLAAAQVHRCGRPRVMVDYVCCGTPMNLQRLISSVIVGAMLSTPVLAADRDPFAGMESLLTPQVLLGGLISERDVSLLFTHLRASLLATSEGREPPAMPAALSQRIESAGGELRLRGTLIGLALSQVMERAALDALRDFAQPVLRDAD